MGSKPWTGPNGQRNGNRSSPFSATGTAGKKLHEHQRGIKIKEKKKSAGFMSLGLETKTPILEGLEHPLERPLLLK